MKIDRLEVTPSISPNSMVRLKECGNIIEIMHTDHKNTSIYIEKLDKDHYIYKTTGEVFEIQHNTSRVDDLKTVSRSLAQGRDILNTNITDVSYCRWLTLTYGENMTDPKKLYYDFLNFNKRCREKFGHYEYITAAEPQGRGAWHLHVVMIFDHKAPYMANDIVANLWKQGFVTVKRLDDVDNVGAYLTAYLGDMELTECELPRIDKDQVKEVEYTDENGNKASKRYVKGARLHMYPAGFHIFRWSKGIKKPVISQTSYERAKEKASSAKLTFSKAMILEDTEKDFKSQIVYEYYNTLRK